jgi:hypothetical protein
MGLEINTEEYIRLVTEFNNKSNVKIQKVKNVNNNLQQMSKRLTNDYNLKYFNFYETALTKTVLYKNRILF